VVGARLDGQPHASPSLTAATRSSPAPGGGKTTLATALIERCFASVFPARNIDLEGDCANLRGAVLKAEPRQPEVMKALERPGDSVVVNMLA